VLEADQGVSYPSGPWEGDSFNLEKLKGERGLAKHNAHGRPAVLFTGGETPRLSWRNPESPRKVWKARVMRQPHNKTLTVPEKTKMLTNYHDDKTVSLESLHLRGLSSNWQKETEAGGKKCSGEATGRR